MKIENEKDDKFNFELRYIAAYESKNADAKTAFERFAMRNGKVVAKGKTIGKMWYAAICVAACATVALLLHVFLADNNGILDDEIVYNAVEVTSADVSVKVGNKVMTLDALNDSHLGLYVDEDNRIAVDEAMAEAVSEVKTTEVMVPASKTAVLTLPDGSKVWIGAGSRLTFPTRFDTNSDRKVALVGEAYFDVAHNEEWPFVVECDGFSTKVLGTEFNVKNVAGEEPRVTLVEGRVAVNRGNYDVVLKPRQMACVSASGGLMVAAADVDVVTSWKNGTFYFDGQTMREILVEVGRWYNMDVVFSSKHHIEDMIHFNAERSWSVHETVDCLNMISDARIAIDGERIVVL